MPSLIRGVVAPTTAPLLPLLLRHRLLAAGIWLLAQFWVHYRRSPLTMDLAPELGQHLRPGERVADEPVTTQSGQTQLQQLLAAPPCTCC